MLGERPKTAEELNAELYEKVSTEFEEYKNNLLMLPPEQLLEHAYAYAVRSDIVIAMPICVMIVGRSSLMYPSQRRKKVNKSKIGSMII